MTIYKIIFLILLVSSVIFAQKRFPQAAHNLSLDQKFHDVGKVWQVITNMGAFNIEEVFAQKNICEYPIGSGTRYLSRGAMLVAGKANNQKLFSSATRWAENSQVYGYEFFPTDAPWDTVWIVNRGETADIPYFPNYKVLADQDLVCRYRDYQIPLEEQVAPMYLDVIQISHAWSSAPFNEFILYDFYVIPTRVDLTDVWLAWWALASMITPTRGGRGDDDLVYFDEERHMGVVEDQSGLNDDDMPGPIGFVVFPPDNVDPRSLNWTFNNRIMTDHLDEIQYDIMSAGIIDPPSTDGDGGDRGFFRLAFGPIDLAVGDTAHFMVGEILGEGKENFLRNADNLIGLSKNNFQMPFAPPAPNFQVSINNHSVTLNWEPQVGRTNPEEYEDPYRFDGSHQPFEGYRVYKSTHGFGGPWTLLIEYDIPGNAFFNNTGIRYEYTDVGLVNNVEYYYTVTSFSKPDTTAFIPSQESSLSGNASTIAPGTAAPETVGEVAVVPNPYRADISYSEYNPPWESPGPGRQRWVEQDRKIQFINIPKNCEIKIYTLAGNLVQTIQHRDSERGFVNWNLTSMVNQTVASGIYLFSCENKGTGDIQVGNFVVIK